MNQGFTFSAEANSEE